MKKESPKIKKSSLFGHIRALRAILHLLDTPDARYVPAAWLLRVSPIRSVNP